MGALTDNRKRCFVDLCLPGVSFPPPPFKKPKFPSPPPPEPPPDPSPSPITAVRCLPPLAPLPRPVHAPQRIIRAFGLGTSKSQPKPPDLNMGGLFSHFFHRKKSPKSEDRSHERLGLEDYKKLVSGVQEGQESGNLGLPRKISRPVSGLTIVTRKEEYEDAKLRVVKRKVDDARKIALEVGTPVVEREDGELVVKKGPLYKELLEDSARKHDARLSSLQFELKLTESKVSAFQLARLEAEKKFKKEIPDFFAPLTNEEAQEVNYAMHDDDSDGVVVTHKGSNIEITKGVLQCLSSGAWLNDEVINLYLELLKEREKREPNKFLRCHFFSTFFYKKLISGRNGYDFKAVRRWTTQRKIGYGLIECDKIFVPIHKEVHWCLAVINVKDKKFQYLDSLGGMDTNVLRVLARFFMDEVKDKSDKHVDTTSWKQEMVEDLPLQKNGWDCGMFMLKYADFYSRGLDLCFGQEHMGYFRKRTAKEILRLRAE